MQTLAPLFPAGSRAASLVNDRFSPALPDGRLNHLRLSRLSVPAVAPNGNVLVAMDRSAESLAAIPAPPRRAQTKRLPKPDPTGPTAAQKVGKAIAQTGRAAAVTGKVLGTGAKRTLRAIDRSMAGFD